MAASLLGAVTVATGCSKPNPAADPEVRWGKTLFTDNGCVQCHGTDGDGGRARDLSASTKDRDSMARVITHGVPDDMPEYGTRLKPDEILAIATFTASLKLPYQQFEQ